MRRRGPLRKAVQTLRRQWRRQRAGVHIISYPKCGRTWLVLLIGKALQVHFDLRVRNLLRLRSMASRRRGIPYILQHHDGGPEFRAPETLQRDKTFYRDRRVVFLVRDPRDVLVSSYFQKTRRNNDYEGTLAEYVHERVGGIETIVEFFNIWAQNRGVPRDFLLVTYEDLHRDTAGELRRVLDFLGLTGVSDTAIEAAVAYCRFDNMRSIEAENQLGTSALAARDRGDMSTYKTRKGEVGGYREHLSETDIEYIDGVIEARLDTFYGRYRSEPASAGAE